MECLGFVDIVHDDYQHEVPIRDLKQGNDDDSLEQRNVTSITLATNETYGDEMAGNQHV